MDIVVPYRQDAHNGLELKYALRSIEKYFHAENIILVGDKPDWITNVIHIQAQDHAHRKEFSIKEKILTACKLPLLSDNFLMWHDDHFALKPTEIKYWHNGLLKDELKKATRGYKGTMERTIERFPEGKNFDIHFPIVFNKQKFTEIMIYQDEVCLKSFYCNSLNIEGEYITDLKLNRPMVRGEIMASIDKRLFFSTGPLSLVGEMVEVWNELYPEKSKFEK